MKAQNKSVYTRRFNKLRKQLIEHYGVQASDTAVLRWTSEACIVAHDGSLGFTLYFADCETGTIKNVIQITKTPYCSLLGLVGIHVQETDFEHMVDQIDTALRDGFESIYIRSIGKVA